MQEPITLQLSTLLKTSHDTSFKPFNLSYFNYLFTSFPLLASFSTFTFLSSDLLTTTGKLLWSQKVDNIQDSFRGVDFSCHGVVSCSVVGWTTLVIGWSSLVMERPSLAVGWLSLVMGWPSLVMEQSSLVVGWSSLVVVGSSFVVGGNP